MDDLDPFTIHESRKGRGGERIEFPAWSKRQHTQSAIRGALGERLARPGSDHALISGARQGLCEPQYLALTAAPAALRIDVKDRNR